MDEQKIQLSLTPGVSEVIIREGSALPVLPPIAITESGLITAPSEYFTKRNLDITKSHVVSNRNQRSIKLVVNESDPYRTIITGTLRFNPELAAFSVNENKMFTLKELTNVLRTKRMYFDELDEYSLFLKSLNNFYAKTTAELKDADDRKGNSEKSIKRQTEIDTKLSFTLNIAVYEGQKKNKIFVDVLVDISDGSARFWLESIDLTELKYNLAEGIMNDELTKFGDQIVIIEV